MTLFEAVSAFCARHGFDKTYWLAYSGGLDSHVLLSLCAELRTVFPLKLKAIHIHHGLSAQADKWAKHCARVCREYDIDYIEHAIQLDLAPGDSLEEIVRTRRYAVLAECLGEGDILLTAHQQDDQAETLLLQLFRGAGLKGLAAMPSFKPFARGFHGRPLLAFPRAELRHYADAHHLEWMEDESNQDLRLTRNFIRHTILGPLKARWPTIVSAISRSAGHCAEAHTLLAELTTPAFNLENADTQPLSIEKLLPLDAPKQRWMLRTWIERSGFPVPDTRKMETIRLNVLSANWDRLPVVEWGNTELRRHRDKLYLMSSLLPHDPKQQFEWDLTGPLPLPFLGALHVSMLEGAGLRADIQQVSVRFRQGGEKIPIPGRGRRTLKNLLQEWDVLPWERDRLPLIFAGGVLAMIPGYFIHPDFEARKGEKGLAIQVVPVA